MRPRTYTVSSGSEPAGRLTALGDRYPRLRASRDPRRWPARCALLIRAGARANSQSHLLGRFNAEHWCCRWQSTARLGHADRQCDRSALNRCGPVAGRMMVFHRAAQAAVSWSTHARATPDALEKAPKSLREAHATGRSGVWYVRPWWRPRPCDACADVGRSGAASADRNARCATTIHARRIRGRSSRISLGGMTDRRGCTHREHDQHKGDPGPVPRRLRRNDPVLAAETGRGHEDYLRRPPVVAFLSAISRRSRQRFAGVRHERIAPVRSSRRWSAVIWQVTIASPTVSSTDTRSLQQGQLFVRAARSGTFDDGHDYLAAKRRHGAVMPGGSARSKRRCRPSKWRTARLLLGDRLVSSGGEAAWRDDRDHRISNGEDHVEAETTAAIPARRGDKAGDAASSTTLIGKAADACAGCARSRSPSSSCAITRAKSTPSLARRSRMSPCC